MSPTDIGKGTRQQTSLNGVWTWQILLWVCQMSIRKFMLVKEIHGIFESKNKHVPNALHFIGKDAAGQGDFLRNRISPSGLEPLASALSQVLWQLYQTVLEKRKGNQCWFPVGRYCVMETFFSTPRGIPFLDLMNISWTLNNHEQKLAKNF